ncbi:MAG: DUF3800 domain-containing protein [Bifidobacteriaceae bacterium]|jgi:hypothetical protein|nr:DUF3800 domain-containing protein [Bifidobacteriaceae bacterium]
MTTTVYLDESGDLGFNFKNKKTSKFFLITALVCPHPRAVDKAVKKVALGLRRVETKASHGALHAFRESDTTKARLLRLLARLDVSVVAIILEKERGRGPDAQHMLYRRLAGALVEQVVLALPLAEGAPLDVVASRRETKRLLNREFVEHLSDATRQGPGSRLNVTVTDPAGAKGLQAVDCVSWSLFRKVEHGDQKFADIIEPRVKGLIRVSA